MAKYIECKRNLHLKDFKVAISNGLNPRKDKCLCDNCQDKVIDDILGDSIKVKESERKG
jgi:hypothetical protein